jgi:hypothetical protein
MQHHEIHGVFKALKDVGLRKIVIEQPLEGLEEAIELVQELPGAELIVKLEVEDYKEILCKESANSAVSNLRQKNFSIRGCLEMDEMDRDWRNCFEFCQRVGIQVVDWNITCSSDIIPEDIHRFYHQVKKQFFSCLDLAVAFGIKLNNKCHNFPLCILTAEELRKLNYVSDYPNTNVQNFSCVSQYDISYDLQVARCAGLNYYVGLDEFDNYNQLVEFFVNEVDAEIHQNGIFKKCGECRIKNPMEQCGCLVFKL